MTSGRRNVGRLSGLLTVAAEAGQAAGAQTMRVTALRVGEGQPRREFDADRLEQLAESIRRNGVLQPLLVRPVGDGYEIVAGERRWRAAQLAGLTELPVVIRSMSDREARQAALIENLQRDDLNTVDEVDGKLELVAEVLGLSRAGARLRLMQLLREPEGPDHAALADLFSTLGESWSGFAKNKLRILNWPAPVLEAVRSGLPFTLGSVVVTAPPEHQAEALELARSGASREAVRTFIRERAPQPTGLEPAHVARVLSSVRWQRQLTEADQAAMQRWLSEMPTALRRALTR